MLSTFLLFITYSFRDTFFVSFVQSETRLFSLNIGKVFQTNQQINKQKKPNLFNEKLIKMESNILHCMEQKHIHMNIYVNECLCVYIILTILYYGLSNYCSCHRNLLFNYVSPAYSEAFDYLYWYSYIYSHTFLTGLTLIWLWFHCIQDIRYFLLW